ncbi:ABC transporter substrate-binding protein [Nocardioides massiliensis]|uniref:Peptide/nickel transport system substrate-binding protein n=1 Tax=Nocardioides massiliensis TaxID=1325935 RepID=A0ABT9NU46_9ACTN|nr:ABC transporter substrate-binding protein [Nocardioides massiliensis]MDP9823947.1 peptide/nickel transport system substrate-binding protein [Nocardioides massiliensis]
MKRLRTGLRPAVALVAAALVLTACGGGSDDDQDSNAAPEQGSFEYVDGMFGPEDDASDPQQGGTLTYAAYSEARSLDPAVSIAAASTGGIEMAALYDVLMRYDAESEEFVPQLAEGLESNDDLTEWTLTLREGVEFSDGTPLDAQAVADSQERYYSHTAPDAGLWNANIASVDVQDPRTVVYTMKQPFAWFDSLLASGPGMIVAEAAGPVGDAFKPVGAGPFVLERQRAGEELVLAANENYWNGRPHLDELRFVFLGEQTTVQDSFESGSIQAGYFRDPDVVDPVLESGVRGYSNLVAISDTALINGTEGRPGADVRVRKAMQLALAPEMVRTRVYDGHGMASARIFPEYSRWYAEDVDVLEPDVEEAKTLLEEAKADGYDGKITYLDSNTSAGRDTGQVAKSALEAVGFEVDIELLPTVTDLINRMAVERDYDFAGWGLNYREADPFSKLFTTLHSTATQTYGMPTSPEMDAALEKLQGAQDDATAQEALAEVQEAYNETVPFLTWMPFAELSAWADNVHGVKGAANSIVLFDEAWMD